MEPVVNLGNGSRRIAQPAQFAFLFEFAHVKYLHVRLHVVQRVTHRNVAVDNMRELDADECEYNQRHRRNGEAAEKLRP